MDRYHRVPAVLVAAFALLPGAAHADANTVREVSAHADGAKTIVTVRGDATPSFTVYRLEQPARLVVDLAGGRLESLDGPIDVDTWAVGQIAFAQYSNTTMRTARVMIGLKRAASYDVKAQGTDLLVTITPDESPPPGAIESARAAEAAQKARIAEEERRRVAEAARATEEERAQQARSERQSEEQKTQQASAARSSEEQRRVVAESERQSEEQKARAAAANRESEERRARQAIEARGEEERRARQAVEARSEEERRAQQATLARGEEERRMRAATVARNSEEKRMQQAAEERGQEEQRRKSAEASRQRAEADAIAARASRDLAQAELNRLAGERKKAERALEAARAEESRSQGMEQEIARREAKLAEVRARQEQAAARTKEQESELASRLATLRSETEKLANAREAERKQVDALRAEHQRLAAENQKLSEEQARETAELARQRSESKRLADSAAQTEARANQPTPTPVKTATTPPAPTSLASAKPVVTAAPIATTRPVVTPTPAATAKPIVAPAPAPIATARPVVVPSTIAATKPVAPAAIPSPVAAPEAPAPVIAAKHNGPSTARTAESHEKAAAHSTSRVTSIDFKDEQRVARVVIGIAGEADFTVLKAPVTLGAAPEPRTAVLRIRAAVLPPQLARTLDTSAFGGPVSAISSYTDPEDPGAVRVVVKLGAAVEPEVRRERGRIVWDFPKAMLTGSFEAPRMAGYGLNALPLQVGEPIAPAPGRQVGPPRRRWNGAPVNLDLKDVDIHNLLRLLSEVGNVNIITSDDVKGTVTIRIKDTPWDQALDVILRQKGLGQIREGNIIRVAPQAVLEKEREAEVAQTKIIKELLPLETRLVPLSYASADKILPRVQDLLSPRGKVSVDERTNTLIITDIAGNLALARDLIANLDTQTPQVLIEARIVEATTNFTRDVGVQWGGTGLASSATGNPTGLVFPSTVGVGGGSVDQVTKGDGLLNNQAASPNYVVNLPAAVGTGAGGALGLTLGSINGAVNVNLRLSAAESTGTVRILSAPKVTTLDNVQAIIEQGTSIPISVVSAAGVNTVFVDAKLNLTVKPHVTHEGSVVMLIEITRNEPDFSQTGARGDPTIIKRQAKTEMLVRDGDTAVIGGIYTRTTSTNYSKVPWLADIPILGWLFKARNESDARSELLIFITPRIVNRAASIAPR